MMSDDDQDAHALSRRMLLSGAARVSMTAVAAAPTCGTGAKRGSGPCSAGNGPPETTTLRMVKSPVSCFAAQAVASEFFKQEGFTDVQYLDIPLQQQFIKLGAGAFDMHLYPTPLALVRVGGGDPVVMLGGLHVGCWQLFGSNAMVDLGFIDNKHFDATLADLRMVPYHVWRQYDPADTLRCYALRLREAGVIKSTPEQIAKRGTDFGFLQELKDS